MAKAATVFRARISPKSTTHVSLELPRRRGSCQVVVMEFGKRHYTNRHNGLLPAPTSYGLVTETCYGVVPSERNPVRTKTVFDLMEHRFSFCRDFVLMGFRNSLNSLIKIQVIYILLVSVFLVIYLLLGSHCWALIQVKRGSLGVELTFYSLLHLNHNNAQYFGYSFWWEFVLTGFRSHGPILNCYGETGVMDFGLYATVRRPSVRLWRSGTVIT